MINFKQKHEQVPSALILISLIALVVTFGVYLWVLWVGAHPTGLIARSSEFKLHSIQMKTNDLKTQEKIALQSVAPKVWSGNVEIVSASILAQLTAQGQQQGVSITSFRPSKPTMINGVTELPITLQLSGSYKGVHAVLASIDAPVSRVVLVSVQLSSGLASKGTLTANIGLAAFINSTPNDESSAPNKPVSESNNLKGTPNK
jgi:hypothetical protein